MIPLEDALKHQRYSQIPEGTLADIYAYVEIRQPVGHFLGAVLKNDLFEAFGRADEDSRNAMFAIVSFLWNEVRHDCYGSPERVRAWLSLKPEVDLASEIFETARVMNLVYAAQLQKP